MTMATRIFPGRVLELLGGRTARIALLALLAGALYANAVPNEFNGDDNLVLLEVPAVHGLSFGNLEAIFTSAPNSLEYLPVRDLSYALDYSLWGLNPHGYHLANVIYYAAGGLCLYFLLARLLPRWSDRAQAIAFWATIFFIAHPVHSESVAGIAHRNDLLSGLFLFASLWSFVAAQQAGRAALRALSVACAALALFSKSTAVVLPGLILLVDLSRQRGARPSPGRILRNVFPYLLLAGLATAVNIAVAWQAGRITGAFSMGRVPTAFRAALKSLWLLIYPYPLAQIHELALSESTIEPAALAAYAAVGTMIFLAVRFRRALPIPAFSIAWFLLCLAPVVGLVPSAAIVAERYLFLPSAGFCIFLGWLFIAARQRPASRLLGTAVFAAVLCLWAALIVHRNREWKNIVTLWAAEVRRNPDSARVNQTYARVLFRNGFHAEAMSYFRRTRKLDPHDRSHEFFSALREYQRGDYRAAMAILNALGRWEVVDVQYLYGLALAAIGDRGRARQHVQNALAGRVTISAFTKREIAQTLDLLNRTSGR